MIPTFIGYGAVFTGTILEGEIALIIAGIAVRRGILDVLPTFIIAFLGAYAGDLIWFFMGRYRGHYLIKIWPWLRKMLDGKLGKLVHQHFNLISFGMRFMYGLRSAVPLLLGMSKIETKRFVLWNGLGVFVWTSVTFYLGYFFGGILSPYFKSLKRYEHRLMLIALGIIIIVTLFERIVRFFMDRYAYAENGD